MDVAGGNNAIQRLIHQRKAVSGYNRDVKGRRCNNVVGCSRY